MKPASQEEKNLLTPTLFEIDIQGFEALGQKKSMLAGKIIQDRDSNYLGFPLGISGQELADRAYIQAQKFGAKILIAQDASILVCSVTPYRIVLQSRDQICARSIVIATGSRYRKLAVDQADRFEGQSLYYGATSIEASFCVDDEVFVIGSGNSAGQAAVYLSEHSRHVHLLVRGKDLSSSMSQYLINRIEASPKITLRTESEIAGLHGNETLETVQWRDKRTGVEHVGPIRHIFVMTGADPNTAWLQGCLLLDSQQFVQTEQRWAIGGL